MAKKKKNRLPIILFSVVSGVILIGLLACYLVISHYYKKLNVTPLDKDYVIHETTGEFIEDLVPTEPEPTRPDTSVDELDEYKQAAMEAAKEHGIDKIETKDVYNILLVGSDSRTPGDYGRSDTMMLVSINNKTKKIVVTSFLRDLYVYIPHKDYWDKINAAYAYGGVNLLFETIEKNFSLEIDQYVMVDFFSFINVIDILGGIDVDVQEEELYWCNQYIHANNLLLGDDEFSDYLAIADGSYQHLNGKQVLAYSRFRYVGNADFSRTERQRKVMNIVFNKLKTVDAGTVLKLLDSFLPEVTTSIPYEEFIELLSILPDMFDYEIVSWGLPDEDFKYITVNGQSHIGIDFKYYIEKLYGLMYTDKTLEDF